MADELIDIVDEKNNLTGVQKMKSEAHKHGLWHRTAHVWLYSSKGDILLQLRANNKLLYPALWDVSAAGHVGAGEEPMLSALRETSEEIGLNLKKDELCFLEIRRVSSVYREIINNEFYYVYLANFEGELAYLKPQREEVAELKFISLRELEVDLHEKSKNYVQHGKYWDDIITKIKERIS